MSVPIQPSLMDRLRPTISPDRLGPYLRASGFDEDRTLRLYIWNAHIGEAFHLPVQATEVGLRNRTDLALRTVFGPEWWQNRRFLQISGREGQAAIEMARRRIAGRGKALSTPQMIANLSFGFWVGTLQPAFNPELWSRQLRASFPDLPMDKTRYDLAEAARRVADLRNRIWHHEPIFRMNLSEEFSAVMKVLSWISPVKEAWIRTNCWVQTLLRQKP
jgi:hypothetical protein